MLAQPAPDREKKGRTSSGMWDGPVEDRSWTTALTVSQPVKRLNPSDPWDPDPLLPRLSGLVGATTPHHWACLRALDLADVPSDRIKLR